MIKLILPLALITLATLLKIYRDFQGDKKRALMDTALLLFLLAVTLFSTHLRIYLPLLLAHILLLLVAWGSYYRYLFGGRRILWLMLSPLGTIALFFLFGLLDRTLL